MNGGEFAAWKQGGDIVAGFFGHDHVNDFIIPYEGIDLINTNSTGFYIYGAGENHGARLVTLRESDPTAYETRMLYYKDLIGHKAAFRLCRHMGHLCAEHRSSGRVRACACADRRSIPDSVSGKEAPPAQCREAISGARPGCPINKNAWMQQSVLLCASMPFLCFLGCI